jgi:hypothetical protein
MRPEVVFQKSMIAKTTSSSSQEYIVCRAVAADAQHAADAYGPVAAAVEMVHGWPLEGLECAAVQPSRVWVTSAADWVGSGWGCRDLSRAPHKLPCNKILSGAEALLA